VSLNLLTNCITVLVHSIVLTWTKAQRQ